MAAGSRENTDELPKIPAWFQNGFHRFLGPYLKRHFQAVCVEKDSLALLSNVSPTDPVIVYANHPSWWDPLVAHFLNRRFFPHRQFWAPIDADALKQYEVFKKLGFFGIQSDARAGAEAFLKTSRAIMRQKNQDGESVAALWMTPEGRFADARDTSATLMPGLSHLCSKMTSGFAIPLAMEYVFWDERLPFCLVQWGQPMSLSMECSGGKQEWSQRLADGLRETQSRLSHEAIRRDTGSFENLLVGKTGAGGLYDWMRRAKAVLTGRRFKASHGDSF